MGALRVIERLRLKEARAAIQRGLRDDFSDVRMAAADAALSVADPHLEEALADCLFGSPAEFRRRAVLALKEIAPARVHEVSLRAIGDSDAARRALGAELLADAGGPESLLPLTGLLRDRYGPVRSAASRRLGETLANVLARTPTYTLDERTRTALTGLIGCLADRYEVVQERAADALAILPDEWLALGCGSLSDAQLEAIASAGLQSVIRGARSTSARALGWAGSRASLPALRRRLLPLVGESDPTVRSALHDAVEMIEGMTRGTAFLPRPSAGLDASELPRPIAEQD
jgi:HEAT repeat protein